MVSARNKVQKGVSQFSQILQGYQAIFASHRVDTVPNWGDIKPIGFNAGIFPPEMGGSAAALTNPWGGGVSVQGDSVNDGIAIGYWQIPNAACVGLASAILTNVDQWSGYSIGLWGGPGSWGWTVPSTATITTQCTAGNNNTVFIEFRAR